MNELPKTSEQWLEEMKIEAVEGLEAVSRPHLLRCLICKHLWTATPTSKIQNFKKHGAGGCPECSKATRQGSRLQIRAENVQRLQKRGFIILSNWDGSTVDGSLGGPVNVTVIQTQCGHEFTATAKNLLTRNVHCNVCH